MFNLLLGYISLIIVLSFLPHWGNIPVISWINQILCFLLFLITTTIALKDPSNKDIFFNLSIFFFMLSFSFLSVYFGDHYLIGSDRLMYRFFLYKRLLFSFIYNLAIIYAVMKYFFQRFKPVKLYLITLLIIIPTFIYNFYPYLVNFDNFMKLGENYLRDLSMRTLQNSMLSIVFLLFFGYFLYIKDIILGEYINSLMAFLFIDIIFGMIYDLTTIYGIQAHNLSQYFQNINLLLIGLVLFKKLCFLCTDYGQFYEKLLGGSFKFNSIKIQRRHFQSNSFILKVLKIYFSQRLNYIITFIWLSVVVFMYFRLSKFITVNVVALFFCMITLFYFTNALYRKREKQRHIISGIVESDL